MSIIIMTETEDVKYSCICKNTEKFRNIEENFMKDIQNIVNITMFLN